MLVSTNIAWGLLRPLKHVPHTAQPPAELTKAAMVYKFQRLKEQKSPPEFAIFGSSLPMCAFYYAECQYFDLAEEKRIGESQINLLQAYPRSGYLTHKLSEAFKTKTNVFNFSGAACMVSDARVMLDRSIAIGKAPKTIFYGVGLRDFVDNVNPPPGETPIYTALCDFGYLLKNLPETINLPAFPHLLISSVCNMYGLRNEFKLAFEHNLCSYFHRSSSLEIAFNIAALNAELKSRVSPQSKDTLNVPKDSDSKRGVTTPSILSAAEPVVKAQTSRTTGNEKAISGAAGALQSPKESAPSSSLSSLDYAQRYFPANYRRLEKEMDELRLFIDRCKEKHIELVLINMPVSSGHPAISPPGLRDRYLRELEQLAGKSDLLYLNYERNTIFKDSDFFDTVHLNPDGSHKFIDDLVKQYHQHCTKRR